VNEKRDYVPVPHLDVEARQAKGKACRAAVPRSEHAALDLPSDRPDPVALLQGQEVARVPELLAIRHERMLASPFAFYRGAAVIMAADLGAQPNSGLKVQACGDAHLANFGGFAAPDRAIVFDMNDFDETTPGPFEWDVKRLATSFVLAARSLVLAQKDVDAIARTSVSSYRKAMAEFAEKRNLELWYARIDAQSIIDQAGSRFSPEDVRRFEKAVSKAEGKDNLKAFAKLTERDDDGDCRIASDPPLIVPVRELVDLAGVVDGEKWIHDRFVEYRRTLQPDRRHLLEGYRVVDMARKVVGVGSVGTRTWILLLLGKDDNDPLMLQIKEAAPSVLEAYAGKSGYASNGQRVVEGQRLLQATSDILLGWIHVTGVDGVPRDYYVRQLWDGKMSPSFETMTPAALRLFAELCGRTLARGHARSGDRIAISAYLGNGTAFDDAVVAFSNAYADLNDLDYEAVTAAVKDGRLAASAAR
jgi:uncharacterized protein (DUF2252 family)